MIDVASEKSAARVLSSLLNDFSTFVLFMWLAIYD